MSGKPGPMFGGAEGGGALVVADTGMVVPLARNSPSS